MGQTYRAGVTRQAGGEHGNRDAPVPARRYDRSHDLPRLLPLWPHEIGDVSLEGRLRVIRKLESALRAERRRGLSGHWTYDLARHAQLIEAWRAEVTAAELGMMGT